MARILQVCNTGFYMSGFLAPLIRALTADGHTVECVCEAEQIQPIAERVGATVHRLSFPRRASPAGFARGIGQMRRLIRAGSYDCVNGHNRNASIVARIAAWLERIPVNLYTAHGFYFHDGQSRYQREATIHLEAALARITTFTLSQAAEDAELMIRRRFIAPDRIAVIGNGIDTMRFRCDAHREDCEDRLGLRRGRFRVGTVGRLVKGKGFLDLLRAFAELHRNTPCADLLLIGGNIDQDISPVQREFLEQARQLGVIEAVTVTGIVREVEQYLSTCDVFVLPSYREGMPRALLEAMSMGLPVIATDIRGCREIVTHGQNGLLYPAGDAARLRMLLTLLQSRPAPRSRLGTEARTTVVNRYQESEYVARQVSAIDRLLSWPEMRTVQSSLESGSTLTD